MNFKMWKVVVVAIVATLIAGCSPVVSQPPVTQPTAPAATPSPSQEAPTEPEPSTNEIDAWNYWGVEGSEKNEGAAEAAAEYGLKELRTAKNAPYESIGLLKGEKCIVFFSLPAIHAEWPMNLSVLDRSQPEGTDQPLSKDHQGIKSPDLAKFAIQTSGDALGCFG